MELDWFSAGCLIAIGACLCGIVCMWWVSNSAGVTYDKWHCTEWDFKRYIGNPAANVTIVMYPMNDWQVDNYCVTWEKNKNCYKEC